MKKIFILTLLFSTAIFTNKAYSQFNVGVELALPLGDFGDLASLGVGASAGYDFPVTDNLKVGGNAGYLFMLVKSEYEDLLSALVGTDVNVKVSMIPIQGHVKYGVTEQFYLQGMAGLHLFNVKVEALGQSESDNSNDFSFGFGAGVNLGQVDIAARFQIISSEGSSSNYIGARAAYNFGGGD